MKKVLLLTAAVMLLAVPAMAGIASTRHNLGTTGLYGYKTAGSSEICVFCHTPHNAQIKVPIWNRNANVSTFKMYTGSATFSGAAKANLDTTSNSRLCLSCHETMSGATLATGTLNDGSRGAITTGTTVAAGTLAGKATLGTDLSNDHPVNFAVPLGSATEDIVNPSTTDYVMGPAGALLPLFRGAAAGEYLECATCHDPHKQVRKFLRKTNGTSALCLNCHTK